MKTELRLPLRPSEKTQICVLLIQPPSTDWVRPIFTDKKLKLTSLSIVRTSLLKAFFHNFHLDRYPCWGWGSVVLPRRIWWQWRKCREMAS